MSWHQEGNRSLDMISLAEHKQPGEALAGMGLSEVQ